MDPKYYDLLEDELNVKAIEITDSSGLIDYQFKPQLRSSGRASAKNSASSAKPSTASTAPRPGAKKTARSRSTSTAGTKN